MGVKNQWECLIPDNNLIAWLSVKTMGLGGTYAFSRDIPSTSAHYFHQTPLLMTDYV